MYINYMYNISNITYECFVVYLYYMDNSISLYSEKSYISKNIYIYNFRSEMASHYHKLTVKQLNKLTAVKQINK